MLLNLKKIGKTKNGAKDMNNTLFKKVKVFAYENNEGDKGIICAKSRSEAEKIFHEKYPGRKIVDNDKDYWEGGAYLFEMDKVQNNTLYCCFPW